MNNSYWHKCFLIWPRRTIDGKWTGLTGQVWRREHNGKWEYRQDPETDQEFLDRAQ